MTAICDALKTRQRAQNTDRTDISDSFLTEIISDRVGSIY
jgi:hypothetical protein